MKNLKLALSLFSLLLLISCSGNNEKSDAYGNFEADEIILSAETNGKIIAMKVEEGQSFKKGDTLALIDTLQLSLQKDAILAKMEAIASKTQDVNSQIEVLQERKNNVKRELDRVNKMLAEGAATQKMSDDMKGEIEAIDKQINATKIGLNIGNRGILAEIKPLEIQLKQVEDHLNKSYIIASIDGAILSKYAELSEFTAMAKPIFKIANLKVMTMRAYISGSMLKDVKIGQSVDVMIDKNEKENSTLQGVVSTISDKAEFTPKIIQTKEERVNLVYAVKIAVENDGSIKIGMPAEVNFKK